MVGDERSGCKAIEKFYRATVIRRIGEVRVRWAALGVFLVLFSAPATAAEWVYVTTDVEGAVHYHDPSSVKRVGNYLAAWEKVDFSRDRTKQYREGKRLWYYDCANEVSALKGWANYMPSGSLVSSHTNSDYSLNWTPAVPDSIGLRFQLLICGN